jgi:hypothetical protein
MFEARADAAPIVESLESLTPFIWSVDKLWKTLRGHLWDYGTTGPEKPQEHFERPHESC